MTQGCISSHDSRWNFPLILRIFILQVKSPYKALGKGRQNLEGEWDEPSVQHVQADQSDLFPASFTVAMGAI